MDQIYECLGKVIDPLKGALIFQLRNQWRIWRYILI